MVPLGHIFRMFITAGLFLAVIFVFGGDAMSLLQVSELTFCYEGSFDNIFEDMSFSVDTDWKLGFIGRNGKGKTTTHAIFDAF